MKTQSQVRPNGSARRAAKQARKKSTPAANGKPSTVTLLFYSWATDDNLGEADIPDEQFRCLSAAAQRAGQPVSEFVAQGIGAMLEKLDGRAASQALTKPVAESDDESPFGWVTITRAAILGLLRAADPVSLSMSEIAERIRRENGFAVSNDEVADDLQLLLHTDPPCVEIEGSHFTITPDGLKVDKLWMVNVGGLPVLAATARAENDGGIQTEAGAGAGSIHDETCSANETKRAAEDAERRAFCAAQAALLATSTPAELAEDYQTKFGKLRESVREAAALALMNGELIEKASRDFSGWERFDLPDFREGGVGLASTALWELRAALDDFEQAHEPLRARARTLGEVVGKRTVAWEDQAGILEQLGCKVRLGGGRDLERCAGALLHLLELQSWLLTDRDFSHAGKANDQAKSALELQLRNVSRAVLRLGEAVAITEFNRTQRAAA